MERCIYGVDLDPLAVELCRLALWIETLDRHLPFSFIDHKIKCGNSLVGAWFDRYRHYPIMAWKGREAGDKTHKNGVHYERNVGTQAIKEFCNGELKDDLFDFLAGQLGTDPRDQMGEATLVHEQAREQLSQIHALPAHCSRERAELYCSVIESEDWLNLKRAFDQWCACWFWPADQIEHAPRPHTFSSPSEETLEVVDRLAEQNRFFHWELEFPDVFKEQGAGFTAIVGNPHGIKRNQAQWSSFQMWIRFIVLMGNKKP